MRRRGFVTAMGSVLALVGGCLGTSSTAETESTRTVDRTTPSREPELESRGPARGQSDADVETSVTESDDDVTYIAANDTVRYVARWRRTGDGASLREPVYETVPFEQWTRTENLTAAARAAAAHADETLGTDQVGYGIASDVDGRDTVALVSVKAVLDRDGELITRPSVSFQELVAATPASVAVTYHLDGQTSQVDAPVYASYDVAQQM